MRKLRLKEVLTVSISVLCIGFTFCGSDDSGSTARNRMSGGQGGFGNNTEAVPVKVQKIERNDISDFIQTTTTLEAERLVDIAANANGEMMELHVEEGDKVKSGQVLAVIDKRDLEAAFNESKVKFENSKMLYERAVTLFGKNLVAQQEVDNQKYQMESSKSQMDRAKLNLDYATVRAPFSGVITQRMVDKGKMIRSSEVMFTIADMVPLRARIYIPEKEMGKISMGQNAQIMVESTPGTEFQGRVTMINPVVDPSSGTVKVTIEITENLSRLRPGMFAEVHIITETHKNSLIIPKKALLIDSEDEAVYVFENGEAKKARLKLGFTNSNDLEVLEGLNEGDLVITIGHEGLREGSAVRISGGSPSVANAAGNKDKSEKRDSTNGDSVDKKEEKKSQPEGHRGGGMGGRGRGQVTQEMLDEFLKNPDVKKEWDKQTKKNPELKTDEGLKRRFYYTMKMKYPSMEELDQTLDRFLSRSPELAEKWEKLIAKDPSVQTDFKKKKKFVEDALKEFRRRMGR